MGTGTVFRSGRRSCGAETVGCCQKLSGNIQTIVYESEGTCSFIRIDAVAKSKIGLDDITFGNMTNETDKIWFNRMQQDDDEGLRLLFDGYYVVLCRYVNTLIEDEIAAEDIVQGIFIYIWEHRHDILITSSVRA